ncbi:MAG: T9SS type A sorting domain-containing protein [Bacteroidetes bacterium]|nr:T9SS type A sorting domain-containing protein [Bacteroidota bacterium]
MPHSILYAHLTDDGSRVLIWSTQPTNQLEFWLIGEGRFEKVAYEGAMYGGYAVLNHSATQLLSWADTTMHLYDFDPPTNREIPGFGAPTFTGGFSPDDRRIVCGRVIHPPYVYDAKTLDTVFSLPPQRPTDSVYRVVYDPLGEWIITASWSIHHLAFQRYRASDGTFIDTIAAIDSFFYRLPGIFVDPTGTYLFAYHGSDYTTPIAAWRLRDPASAVPQTSPAPTPVTAVVPNPVRTTATIMTGIRSAASVRCSIVDLTGATILQWTQPPSGSGMQRIRLSASTLADGVYFCRMQWEGHSQTAPFVVEH